MSADVEWPADLVADLGPLETYDDAKRWLGVGAGKVVGGELADDVALALLRRVRAWRWARESDDDGSA